MKYKRLVVPGRFQPPHRGHLETIRFALGLAEEVIVVIGSAQESFSLRNPLTAGERMLLLRKLLMEEMREHMERLYVVPVMDVQMHKTWVQYLKMLLPPFDGVVSGNELVLLLFEDMGLAAIRPPMLEPEKCNGTIIRSKIVERGEWKECVPPSLREELEKLGFAERVRRLAGSRG
ncbi:MAG: nicotinamide-nucleotide adenylyltransferase [Acidilobaceae archaeon]|nr:nicotinamide-nucleotide adenylyltransferase [Acidilobaceae archaeon]MDW7973965.1 nicotinamide-nucleotide adenylyltransferase [Sulfolobales archaeon]